MSINRPKLIPELKMSYEDHDGIIGFKWADSLIGSRSKIGGSPDFIQSEVIPKCGCCGKAMTFYCQLDSLNDDICFADCGMIYVFVCFDCFSVSSFIQSS